MGWKKGESGNPHGRPKKGNTLTEVLLELAELKREGDDKPRKEMLAAKLWDIAIEGDTVAIKYIYDRIDGKPTEHLEHSGAGPIVIAMDGSFKDV